MYLYKVDMGYTWFDMQISCGSFISDNGLRLAEESEDFVLVLLLGKIGSTKMGFDIGDPLRF